ncbi:septin 4a isoform X2 [Brachyhypopomus gauderio]|uniref:septin 4a isoform X2 n=1 Tax=Brachyhypopomus gauderio TaxID=698409 RepID=UPI004042D3DA
MREPPPRAGHTVPGQETSLMDRELDGSTCSLTPGTPTFIRPVRRNPLDSELELLHPISSNEGTISPSQIRRRRDRFDACHSVENQDKDYVGFATLPNQVHKKQVKKGFAFTLMVAGESGLGKSTLVNSLFLTDIYKDRKMLNAEERIMKTVDIIRHTVGIEEKGVKLQLNIVDTPGFGDAVNNTGSLRPIDVEFMRALHEKVNVVPVLAKADCLTLLEVTRKKIKIREEIERFGIKTYQFPECDSDEDEEFSLQDHQLKDSVPFAVVGSNVLVESKGRRFRGRMYPWGVVEVENPAHSDFLKLRNMLVRTHFQDLKDVTRDTHYENYRAQCIHNMTRMVVTERKRSLCNQLKESVSDLPLVPVDGETERHIWEKDAELRQMQELLQRFQEQLGHDP